MPYTIFKDFQFAAAHFIPEHPGKCRNLHGHNYKVRVYLEADTLDRIGMVVDFAVLKGYLKEIAGPLDHRVINEIPPFDARATTAESIAEYVFAGVSERLERDGHGERVRVRRVEIWENDASGAVYET